ncbi:MAG: hypothetical protein WKG03_08525, partial [Telluria sp.]
MKQLLPALSVGIGVACLMAAAPVTARIQVQSDQSIAMENTEVQAHAAAYWTAERFKAAKPLPLPIVRADEVREEASRAAAASSVESNDAQPPASNTRIAPQRLHTPEPSGARQSDQSEVEPQATGTFGTPFTSTRVFPMHTGANAPLSADRAYPHVTVGKLFFSIGTT